MGYHYYSSRKGKPGLILSIFLFYILIIGPIASFGLTSTSNDINLDEDDLLADPHLQFNLFKARFGKTYSTKEEEDYRFSVFKHNLKRVMEYRKLDTTAYHGVTKYSDLTKKEFLHLFLGKSPKFTRHNHRFFDSSMNNNKASILPTTDLPEDYIWRNDNHQNINTNDLVVSVSRDEGQIKANLVKYGPLTVGFDANFMQTYKGGVSCPTTSCSNRSNHGALLTGYSTFSPYLEGTEPDAPYWIINNSPSPQNWEENGDFWICRNSANVCGVQSTVLTIPAALSTTT